MRKRGYFDSSLEASHTDRFEKELLQQGKSRRSRKSGKST
jgi:hypothetical protein